MNLTEQDIIDDLQKFLKSYTEMFNTIKKNKYEPIMQIKQGFPIKYLQDSNYDDLTLQASDAKHRAIELEKILQGLNDDMKIEIESAEANLVLYFAPQFLKDLGFDKPTSDMIGRYLNNENLKVLKDLKKLHNLVDKLGTSAERLIRAFEADEVNFRRIMDKQTKLIGF